MGRKLSPDELKAIFGAEFLAFFIGLAESAAERARSFFLSGEPYNRTVGATIMRYAIRNGLIEALDVQFSAALHGYDVQSPRNLAIWFEFEGMLIRGYTVPKGKLPIKGQNSADHREKHFANVQPTQKSLFSKEWVANVSLLWSFDKQGHFIGLRAVVGNGWDDQGQLQTLLDFELPTTAAEIRAELASSNFDIEEDNEPLLGTVDEVEQAEIDLSEKRLSE